MIEEKNIYNPALDYQVKTTAILYSYNKDVFEKKEVTENINAIDISSRENRYWLKIVGLKDTAFIGRVCEKFGIHALAEEDIIHTKQRPKLDEYEKDVLVVVKMFYVKKLLTSQQVSFYIKENIVISFEEDDYPIFNTTIDKLKSTGNILRSKGEDYLFYALLDTIIDAYFIVEDKIDKHLLQIEDELNKNPIKAHLTRLIRWRKHLLQTRKGIAPVNDIIQTLLRLDVPYFEKQNKLYLRDLNDHILRVIDHVDTHRETVSSLIELFHSSVNNKMNEVMKTLTIMSSIFIPLSFIASLYGMNFQHMPELQLQNGYYVVLLLMVTIALSLLIYFKYKKYY